MVRFRWHRGLLEDSMATEMEFGDRESLEEYVSSDLKEWGLSKTEFSYPYAGYDSRIGWNTWYVCVNGNCVGMADLGLLKNASN